MNRSLVSVVMVSLICTLLAAELLAVEQREFPLHGESKLMLASVAQGQQLLGMRDEYTAELSRFDLESRLMTRDNATVERLLEHVRAQVQPWTNAEAASVSRALAAIRKPMAKLSADLFPETVWLIKTSGDDEGGAAYCRGNAVILPQRMIDRPPGGSLDFLLGHELFHILSRQNETRRKALYEIVGFNLIEELKLPPSLADRKITNPDAPWINSYITLQHDGGTFHGAPLLYANVERYDPSRGHLFRYMKFELVKLEQQQGEWAIAVDGNGQATTLDPKRNPGYFEQIGKNTRYIIHPEEIMADNFADFLTGRNDQPNPEIVEKLVELLRGEIDD